MISVRDRRLQSLQTLARTFVYCKQENLLHKAKPTREISKEQILNYFHLGSLGSSGLMSVLGYNLIIRTEVQGDTSTLCQQFTGSFYYKLYFILIKD